MKWIRTKDLQAKLALSATGLNTLMEREPDFPKPIQVSERHVVFDEEAVDNWMRHKALTCTHKEVQHEQGNRAA